MGLSGATGRLRGCVAVDRTIYCVAGRCLFVPLAPGIRQASLRLGDLDRGSSPPAPPSLAGKWGRSLARARPEGPDGGGFRCSPCGQGLLPYPVRSMLMFHVKHIPGGSKSRRDRFCPPLTPVPSPGSYARLASNDRWPGAIKAPGKGAHLPPRPHWRPAMNRSPNRRCGPLQGPMRMPRFIGCPGSRYLEGAPRPPRDISPGMTARGQ